MTTGLAMHTELDEKITEQWESGELGRSARHARKVSAEDSAAMESALAMKLVTMRLPEPLIDALKAIANHHGIGYQPMVRDLLVRFAVSEIKQIRNAEERRLEEMQKVGASEAVDEFFERERRYSAG